MILNNSLVINMSYVFKISGVYSQSKNIQVSTKDKAREESIIHDVIGN